MIDKGIDLVESIINNIPDNLSTPLEKARFIYIELGKVLEFNPTFNNTTEFNKFIIKNRRYNIRNLVDNKITCQNWADIYVELLKRVGIKAYKVNKYHAWVIIEIDDMLIYTDATLGSYTDLSRIKHNDEIINFYPVSVEKTERLPNKVHIEGFSELIDEIDKKIGYKKTQYQLLHQLKKKVSEFKTLREKVSFLLREISVINCGYYEATSYIQYVFTLCLSFEDRQNIFMCDFKKTNEDGNVDLMKCISVLEDGIYYYYLFQKNRGISSVSKEFIMEYANDDYGISRGNNSPDLADYPLVFQVPKNTISLILNNVFTFNRKKSNDKKLNKKYYIS